MRKPQLRFLTKESDPKLQPWANGSVAYSVASELDQKDVESVAIAVPGNNHTWTMTLSFGICRAQRGGTTGLYLFLKHFILAEALPPKEIIIVVLLTYLWGEIANNKASWTGSVSLLGICTHNWTHVFQAMSILHGEG